MTKSLAWPESSMANQESRSFFGLGAPIIQAPMAGVSTPELAAAVSNAGGLGSIAIGASSWTDAWAMIEKTRRLTDKPFNVNVFCHAPARRDPQREAAWIEHLRPLFAQAGGEPPTVLREIYKSFLEDSAAFALLLELAPAFVSFHFGLPSLEQIRALRAAGIKTLATATNLLEARAIEAAGIDAIIAQGMEAGGHRGVFDTDAADELWSTAVLVRVLRQNCKRPIIAAGGIMDGQGIKAALDLGAAAAQLGTAFILCPESAASEHFRACLRQGRATTTRMTTAISGRSARGLVNRLVQHGAAPGAPQPPAYPLAYDAAKNLHALALKQGIHDYAPYWAGQGVALARELPARELLAVLLQEIYSV